MSDERLVGVRVRDGAACDRDPRSVLTVSEAPCKSVNYKIEFSPENTRANF